MAAESGSEAGRGARGAPTWSRQVGALHINDDTVMQFVKEKFPLWRHAERVALTIV